MPISLKNCASGLPPSVRRRSRYAGVSGDGLQAYKSASSATSGINVPITLPAESQMETGLDKVDSWDAAASGMVICVIDNYLASYLSFSVLKTVP